MCWVGLDDLVNVHTQVTEAARRRVVFTYRIERDGVRLAEGHTVHLVTGSDGKARVLPEELRRLLGS